ncbi:MULTISPECIES: cupin domain-containing protein [unclassified Streptomyces]|uniref:cupin domain-containing protein n=1 Tax=unclassified Streptomyces TaxID=2593676 RepID=UPI0013A96943|nr:cupin domain-containing protein [Streptomyces sp. SID8499]MYS45122.1 cupin domain-containing protein [Streptomyces sp. SID5998]NED34767.1 cupin domain-containing protein [Streptomyces sp. SID8499]NED73756.1 cupin domain-containing protein [Streptomyces sp. SID9944]
MSAEHAGIRARRVVTGVDADGRSAVLTDELTATRVTLPGFTVNDVWRVDALPAAVADGDTLTGEVVLEPPADGLVVRLATFPPDSWVNAEEYGASIATLHGEDADAGDEGIVGLHVTDTVDVVTVVTGELYCVLETGETLLRPGDTVVNRGNKHAWSNRTDTPATVVATMFRGTR